MVVPGEMPVEVVSSILRGVYQVWFHRGGI